MARVNRSVVRNVRGKEFGADVMAKLILGQVELLAYESGPDPGMGPDIKRIEVTLVERPENPKKKLDEVAIAERMMLWWGARMKKLERKRR
jgi:hypothetical protein